VEPALGSGSQVPDNTPRIRHIAEAVKDEGIVQPVSKEMEQLSPRLHQLCGLPGEIRGVLASQRAIIRHASDMPGNQAASRSSGLHRRPHDPTSLLHPDTNPRPAA